VFFELLAKPDLGAFCGGKACIVRSASRIGAGAANVSGPEGFFEMWVAARQCPARRWRPAVEQLEKDEAAEGFWYDHGEIAQQVACDDGFVGRAFRVVTNAWTTWGSFPVALEWPPDMVVWWVCGRADNLSARVVWAGNAWSSQAWVEIFDG